MNRYDTCCFSPHNRHAGMLAYERNIRAELGADDRANGSHGWFTVAAVNHSKHEVAAQSKTVMRAALGASAPPDSPAWQTLSCDVMHQPLPGGEGCAPDVEPGLEGGVDGYVPTCPKTPCTCTRPPEFPCMNGGAKEDGHGPTGGFTSVDAYFRARRPINGA